ncbi:MAG: GntR family transcriptional regulator [Defluviitaleaceae bacterium]|nr:GntR family transcriptional regulator [Defluviitaleaceae bacterium]MCL2837094.1 GntR family transcriptional regulator [Defluviitaleaceae bacterium]
MEKLFREINLDKSIPIPLYYQLKRQILSMIETGGLKEGDMLPPESEFCAMLSVSRPTIRQSLNELVVEGYLNRYKGRGTFVSKPKIDARFLSNLETFNNEMRAKNMIPRTEVLTLEKITDSTNFHQAAEKLQIAPGAPLIHLSRLRLADESPLVYVETYLPFEDFTGLLDMDFNEKSLYDLLEEHYSVRVSRVRREIEAVNARRNEASLLKIAVNSAISLVKTVGYSGSPSRPVEYSIARYRGDMNKFSVEIYR